MNRKDVSEKAVAHFSEGYNCAQSVLLAMSEHWRITDDLIPKVATAFGGGIGRCGSVCGALTGGIMAIGIKYGTNESSVDKRKKAYEFARELYHQFEREHGSVFCRELIGYDLSDPDQFARAHESNVLEEKCSVYIREIVQAMLELSETLT
jgi:C_GCAxxG_C_C family probable redox protein